MLTKYFEQLLFINCSLLKTKIMNNNNKKSKKNN